MNNNTSQNNPLINFMEDTGWTNAIRAYRRYGYNSPEFKRAEAELQRRCAQAEVEIEARRSWHRAIVKREGY